MRVASNNISVQMRRAEIGRARAIGGADFRIEILELCFQGLVDSCNPRFAHA